MPIKLPKPPAGATDVLRDAGFAEHPGSRRLRTDSEEERGLTITEPHQVYVVGRDAILRGQFLEAARPIAWRYLLVDSDSALAAAELAEDEDGLLSLLTRNDGAFVQSTMDVLKNLEVIPELKENEFELRLVRIPFVYFVALWLQSDDSNLLVPLAPTLTELQAGRIYAAAEILAIVKPYAESSARFDAGEHP